VRDGGLAASMGMGMWMWMERVGRRGKRSARRRRRRRRSVDRIALALLPGWRALVSWVVQLWGRIEERERERERERESRVE
jgi:hypothetical protein